VDRLLVIIWPQRPVDVSEPDLKSVLRRENVFYADDDPVNRVTTYIPWTIAKGTGLLQDEVPTSSASTASWKTRATP
jgi:hypothetical protein